MMKRKLSVLVIIPFLFIGMVPLLNITHGQGLVEESLINGLLTPRIDGLIDNSALLDKTSTKLTEWGDATEKVADFYLGKSSGLTLDQEEEEEPIQARLFSKWVGRDFYLSFDFPKSTLDSVYVQFDYNNDGILSDGDVRLVGANLAGLAQGLNLDATVNEKSFGNENRLEIYKKGTWWDPSELNPEKWNTKGWDPFDLDWDPIQTGFASYADQISNVGKIAISPSGGEIGKLIGPMFDVELRFSPSSYSEFLRVTDPSLVGSLSLSETKNDEIGYSTMITTTRGSTYGYPVRPSIQDNSNTFAMSEYVRDFYYGDILELYSLDVGLEHVEVTQTIQTANNDLSLVRNKQSLARVFVENPTSGDVEVEVTLTAYAFALITIIELGSLSQRFDAPSSPDRTVFSDSANFDMPDDWVSIPWLILKAEVRPVGMIDPNTADNSVTEVFTLKETHDLNIYYIRVNVGTAAAVNQVSQATADSITSAFTASYPVANPNYVQLDWSVLGTDAGSWSSSSELKEALTDIVGEIVFAIIFQLLLGVPDVMPIPDQIFGMKPTGGGSSTPSWGDYDASFASWGSPTASSGNLVMAHEINHNLGDNNWGRHVGNPDEDTWGGTNINKDLTWGCGASGPDSAWPGLNDNLNQDYSDSLGWNPATGLVQNTKDDLMSYCNGGSPAKWISDYRWEALVDRLENFVSGSPAPLSILSLNSLSTQSVNRKQFVPNFTLPSTRIISGMVFKDGGGILNPSYIRVGTITKLHGISQKVNPSYILRVTFENGTTKDYEFEPNFSDHADIDHPQDNSFPFSFWIPDNGLMIKVELYDSGLKLIDSKVGTGFTLNPTTPVDFTIPQTIKRGDKNSIQWNYNELINSSTIFAQPQYSHDGIHWYNIGKQTTGTSSTNDFVLQSLPGGSESQFRLILTDGFDTKFVIASLKTAVPLLEPVVTINKNSNLFYDGIDGLNLNQITFLADPRPSPIGSLVSFKASAFDPQKGSIDPSTLTWTVTEVDSSGLILNQATGIIGDTFRHRFNKPGLYKVEASVTTDLKLSGFDSIFIEIVSAAAITQEAFTEFTKAVEVAKQETSDEKSTKDDGIGLPVTNIVFIVPFIMGISLRSLNRRRNK